MSKLTESHSDINDPFAAGLRTFSQQFKAGTVTAEMATQYCLNRIVSLNEKLQAFEHVNDQALELARSIDQLHSNGTWLGPLMGVPIGIKDIFAVTGMPTTNGSLHASAHLNGAEGTIVQQLRKAGCIIIGKTKTVEFALGATGMNEARGTPWNALDMDEHRIPGGSSSGSAVATATGMCGFALGTDTGGSVRIPACYNSLFGHKTTVGLWPTDGVFPLSPTLDSIGPLTRCAEDAALIHEVITGETVPSGVELSTLRLGIPHEYFLDDLDPAVEQAFDAAVVKLKSAGVTIIDIEIPEAREREALFPDIVPAELMSTLTIDGFNEASAKMDSVTRARAEVGISTTAIAHLDAQKRRVELEQIARSKMVGLDGWLTPTCPLLPCTIASLADPAMHQRALLSSRNTQPSNVFGQCAVTLPIVGDGSSLPAGLQLIGNPDTDKTLLALAMCIELALADKESAWAPDGDPAPHIPERPTLNL